MSHVTVVGGGLAGCEAAWQLARRNIQVTLVEMRPEEMAPAHGTDLLAELVCSNSLKSTDMGTPAGLLKAELAALDSLILEAARASSVPAGSALAVDRIRFARLVTQRIAEHPNIEVVCRRQDRLPDPPAILATGPLTSGDLAKALAEAAGRPLTFYDAIAPIVDADSIDWDHAFVASRWENATSKPANTPDPTRFGFPAMATSKGDYVNCPMDRGQYEAFVDALLSASQVQAHEFEDARYFESCLPIEVMARRGLDVLRHGPMRPIGIQDPATGKRPYAVVQLRLENSHKTAYNMVGFQTRLRYGEQTRIFRMIPGLGDANFLRYGSIHRNSYLNAPACLNARFELDKAPGIRVAGLLAGVEGYMESTAMGLLAGLLLAADLTGANLDPPPQTTALGALHTYLQRDRGGAFIPTNMNMSLFPPLDVEERMSKKERRLRTARRALDDLLLWKA
ncbi:MAG: methylenetetrahydrofolate--tRNA-(uracil(54)-C(5))-methyltransferase (FADH(2)-oxidizing) TrmFO [Deltaproteobacteria bacterium]|nr:methylenetetrahydrofolate--tRNA-(uracil(54)-C(5))-methyltransferase (FADH(2)-oxidizing) TrmFO [Deltaproteobacteria bacterium]